MKLLIFCPLVCLFSLCLFLCGNDKQCPCGRASGPELSCECVNERRLFCWRLSLLMSETEKQKQLWEIRLRRGPLERFWMPCSGTWQRPWYLSCASGAADTLPALENRPPSFLQFFILWPSFVQGRGQKLLKFATFIRGCHGALILSSSFFLL